MNIGQSELFWSWWEVLNYLSIQIPLIVLTFLMMTPTRYANWWMLQAVNATGGECYRRWKPWNRLKLLHEGSPYAAAYKWRWRSISTAEFFMMSSQARTHCSTMRAWSSFLPMTSSDWFEAVPGRGVSWRFMHLFYCGFMKTAIIKFGAAPLLIK